MINRYRLFSFSTLLLLLVIFGCRTTKVEYTYGFKITTEKKGRVTITGLAENAKSGAVVSDSNDTYVVGDRYEWSDRYYGKKVKVSGRLVIVTQEQLDKDRVVAYLPRKNWIKGAVIKIVKK